MTYNIVSIYTSLR